MFEAFIELISPWSLIFGVILGIFIWFDARNYIKREMPRSQKNRRRLATLFATIGILIAILLHEIAHALVGIAFGIKVSSLGLSPIGGFTIFETPMAEINPLCEIAICAAGPLMNLLIGAIALIPVKLFDESLTENAIQYQAYLNIKLAVWNLIPFAILDGGRMMDGVLRYFLGNSIFQSILWIIISGLSLTLWFEYKERFNKSLEKLRKL